GCAADRRRRRTRLPGTPSEAPELTDTAEAIRPPGHALTDGSPAEGGGVPIPPPSAIQAEDRAARLRPVRNSSSSAKAMTRVTEKNRSRVSSPIHVGARPIEVSIAATSASGTAIAK